VVAGAKRWWPELNGGGGRKWREKKLGERVKEGKENDMPAHTFVCFFLLFFFFFYFLFNFFKK